MKLNLCMSASVRQKLLTHLKVAEQDRLEWQLPEPECGRSERHGASMVDAMVISASLPWLRSRLPTPASKRLALEVILINSSQHSSSPTPISNECSIGTMVSPPPGTSALDILLHLVAPAGGGGGLDDGRDAPP
ncbi:hypothetical protein ZWY2020_042591 [Hordeum vulgare]|nr:hypothetical protein ZWY2020_042591 [Hordeum vulgare]